MVDEVIYGVASPSASTAATTAKKGAGGTTEDFSKHKNPGRGHLRLRNPNDKVYTAEIEVGNPP